MKEQTLNIEENKKVFDCKMLPQKYFIATTNFERAFQDNFPKLEYHMMKQSKSQVSKVSKVSPCHHSMGVHG
jgi:hypothetical protein